MRPPICDYHVHTEFSSDSDASMGEACRTAIAAGLTEIGFAEHYDLLPEDPAFGYFRPDAWWQEVERCRQSFAGQLTIRAGIELGEPHQHPAAMSEFLSAFPWDFCFGSMHWVSGTLIWDPAYYARTPARAYADYFAELKRMVERGGFDVLAHMDAIKHYGTQHYGPFDPVAYEGLIRPILALCVQHGIALEVNAGLLRRPVAELSPGLQILRWYRQEGGEHVVLGSDAHSAADVGFGLDLALEAVRAAGFRHLTGFERRTPFRISVEPTP